MKKAQAMFGGKAGPTSMMGVGHPPARPTGVHGQTPATHNGGATPQRKTTLKGGSANGKHGSGKVTGKGQGYIPESGPCKGC